MNVMHILRLIVFLVCPFLLGAASVRELFAMIQDTPKAASESGWNERLNRGQLAARELLSMQRSPGIDPEEWARMITIAHRTLGWTLFQQKRMSEAALVLTSYLRDDPADAEVSYWLGHISVRLSERESDRSLRQKHIEMCLFHLARASVYDGPNALPPTARAKLNTFIRKTYELNYDSRDDDAPLLRVMEIAKTSALPPPGFRLAAKFK